VNLPNFFTELKRRNVYKVAIAYAVVAWLLMQIASQIFPFFDIPNWAVRLVVLLLIIGFPVALILAWAFELTPEGIKRTEDVDVNKSIRRKTGRKLDFFIIAVMLLVIGILVFQRLPPAKDATLGVYLIDNLARIYALTGEKDLALEQLDIVSKIPCGPSYGELRLDPEWDSLRGDPRFEKIVDSLAPKKGSH
jgi:hypothetical protein